MELQIYLLAMLTLPRFPNKSRSICEGALGCELNVGLRDI